MCRTVGKIYLPYSKSRGVYLDSLGRTSTILLSSSSSLSLVKSITVAVKILPLLEYEYTKVLSEYL